MDTVSWKAEFALRTRVSRSATGSVIVMGFFFRQVSGTIPDLVRLEE
jgi:hypothetical protein